MAMPYEVYPIFVAAKRFLDGGAIGRVSSCDGVFAHQGPLHAPWFFRREDAGWGVLADLASTRSASWRTCSGRSAGFPARSGI